MSKTNVLSNFAHSNEIIRKAVASVMATKAAKPSTFRLSVVTPDDVLEEGTGQYKMEAQVVLQLINTAYAELVSALNRTTRKEQLIPLNDRHRHASGWDDQYDGSEEPEETEESIETQIVNAADRAEVILRYAKHIASIKAGGAEWLTGFEVDAWVPVVGLQDDKDGKFTVKEVVEACASGVNLETHILMGRVTKVRSVVDNRLLNFTPWCKAQVSTAKRKEKISDWTMKCAYAATLNVELHDIPVNDAINYIGDLVSQPAFNRKTSRLEDAVRQVGNAKYLSVAYAIKSNAAALKVNESELNKTYIKASEYLPYSDMLFIDLATVQASDEWADHQLDLDVQAAEADAKAEVRAAMREQIMFGIEKRALEVANTRSQADAIRALIAKDRAALLALMPAPAPVDEAAKAKKAEAAKKAAATRAKNAAAKEAVKHVKGVHKASNKPNLNVNGTRH